MAVDGQTVAEQGVALPRLASGRDMSSPSPLVRGACPSLSSPMQTGDGLLVRLRPSTPGLTLSQLRQLATAAARHGNGLIEITARGNFQLRGLSWQTMPALEADIALAGVTLDTGLTIETPPLSGQDPSEIADARAMAAQLRAALTRLPAKLTLAPKLTIIVDGGGRLTLDTVAADIRIMAMPAGDAGPRWLVAVGGNRAGAVRVSSGSDEQAVATVLELLKSLDGLGTRARGRDLAAGWAQQPSFPVTSADAQPSQSALGLHWLGLKACALGLRLAFGQIQAADLIAFLDVAEMRGVDDIRAAPDHSLLLIGPSQAAIADLQSVAGKFGFWTDAKMPASHIATCSGAGGCASATYRTKRLAAAVAGWVPELLDGSIVLHLSGCPKGCAHPAESTIAVVGLPDGFGIVVGGKTFDVPALIGDENRLKSALQRLAEMVASTKAAGESVDDCLTRLGSVAIIAALRQE